MMRTTPERSELVFQHTQDLTAERAGVAASLRAGRASSLLQPGDESVKSEGLREGVRAAGGGRGSRGDRGGGSGGGGGGRSNGGGDSVVLNSDGGSGSRGGRGGGSGGAGRGSSRRVAGAGAGAGAAEESGTGDLVAGEVTRVDVDLDTRVCGGVELVGSHTSGVLSTGTSNLKVDALGVVLGTVLLTSRVEGDDLVAENVLSRSNGAGDSDRPGEVVVDELGSSPLAVLVTSLVDLEEAQVSGLSGGSVVDLGHVVKDRTDVRLGPGVPLDVNGATSSDLSDLSTSSGVLVASNLGDIGVHGGVDETIVKALGAGPLDDLRGRVLVLERGVVGSVVSAINLDV